MRTEINGLMERPRMAVAAIGLLFASGCGSYATAPSVQASALPLQTGTYLIRFTGDESACPGLAAAGIQPVTTSISLTFESGVWRGRPQSSASGSFEVSFSPGPLGPGGPGGGPGVTGTVTGTVISTMSYVPGTPVPDSRMTAATAVGMPGGLSLDGRVGSGLMSGGVVFARSSGAAVNCSPASASLGWFLAWSGS